MLEESWAFAAISFLLGITVFQEYWTRVERLAQMEQKLDIVQDIVTHLPVESLVAKGFRTAVEQLSLIKVHYSREEVYADLVKRLCDVDKRMQIVDHNPTWPPPLPNHAYQAKRDEVVRQGVNHYRVMRIASPTHWQATKDMLNQWKDRQVYIGCFFDETMGGLPIVPCIILDQSEVCFGLGLFGYLGAESHGVRIAEEEVALLFNNYFTTLWNRSIVVKGEKGVSAEALAQVEQRVAELKETRHPKRGIEITRTREDTYRNLTRSVERAEHTLYIASHNLRGESIWEENSSRNTYHRTVVKVCQERGVSTRRMVLLRNLDQLRFLQALMKELETAPFHVACYVADYHPPPVTVPFLSCLIIDDEEVHFGHHYLGNPELDDYDVTIRNLEGVRLFQGYYSYLWNRAILLKSRDIEWAVITKLEEVLQSKEMQHK